MNKAFDGLMPRGLPTDLLGSVRDKKESNAVLEYGRCILGEILQMKPKPESNSGVLFRLSFERQKIKVIISNQS